MDFRNKFWLTKVVANFAHPYLDLPQEMDKIRFSKEEEYSIFNLLKKGNILMVAEGVDVFKVDVPHKLYGRTISESTVREKTGCSIIGIISDSEIKINPDPSVKMEKGQSIILIGSVEAEKKFFNHFIES